MGEPGLPAPLTWEPASTVPQDYAQLSGDRSAVHLDEDIAHRVGLPGVILHGMYVYGHVAAHLEAHARGHGGRLVSFECRFVAPTLPGSVIDVGFAAGEPGDPVQVEARQDGHPVLSGVAVIALSS